MKDLEWPSYDWREVTKTKCHATELHLIWHLSRGAMSTKLNVVHAHPLLGVPFEEEAIFVHSECEKASPFL